MTMTDTQTTTLLLTWSTSKGRETYGYPIVRLDDTSTGKRYRAMGGGYDLIGTVFGEWLQDTHQDDLRAIAHRAHTSARRTWMASQTHGPDELYGMSEHADRSVHLSGACGLESMLTIARAIGLTITRLPNRKGDTVGWTVTR